MVEYIKIKGVETPKVKNDKAREFAIKVDQIRSILQKRQTEVKGQQGELKKYKDAIADINYKISMSIDDNEIEELKEQRRKHKEEYDELNDYKDFDMKEFKRKLFDDPELERLEREAREEHLEVMKGYKEYMNALEQLLKPIRKEYEMYEPYRVSLSLYNEVNRKLMSIQP